MRTGSLRGRKGHMKGEEAVKGCSNQTNGKTKFGTSCSLGQR